MGPGGARARRLGIWDDPQSAPRTPRAATIDDAVAKTLEIAIGH